MSEIEVGLSKFIEFTIKQGPAKLSVVRDVKYQTEYSPATDYWKKLREGIVEMHRNGYSSEYLDHIVESVTDKKKHQYAKAVDEYKKLFKKHEIDFFEPGKAFWAYEDIIVKANPELGLYINGEPHLIKLYLRDDDSRFDKWTTTSVCTLLANSTYSQHFNFENAAYSVVHVKKGKQFSLLKGLVKADNILTLQGEAAHFIDLYKKI
ncbi:hypothetical protein GC096_30445 [Paenibacillus sp. LMG 31461]|uniref:Uncharacterized protein n=1 Tax=Paenibacillus plantarum TaxID=2654975 RepID=A0ABX1XIK2_9BACL|nr:hypothetical protein [Paenibacillus plantarum]NOU68350.1 hypothetical protein [Paenibacillus plantarum]